MDDDKNISSFIADVVESEGYTALESSDMGTFKKYYNEHFPERIILDLQLLGCDGIELIRYLAAEKSTSEIILVSGADRRTLVTAHRLGEQHGLKMGEMLQKPITDKMLEGALRRKSKSLLKFGGEDILAALAEDHMTAVFQPQIVCGQDGRWSIDGVEALARWNHKEFGMITPDKFIPCAEETGMIGPLTDYILQKSLRYIREWEKEGVNLKVAINLSGTMLSDLSLPDRIEKQLDKARVSSSQIVLEVTETAVMSDIKGASDILTRLRLKGFELSMDDFGTGYSSLSQLYRLPFSELKIDRSFVMEMHDNKEAGVIVRSLIDLAHNLGLVACAEGVEDKRTFQELTDLGCKKMQGFYFGKPVNADNLLHSIRQFNNQQLDYSVRTPGLHVTH